jgi:hypothetical protein
MKRSCPASFDDDDGGPEKVSGTKYADTMQCRDRDPKRQRGEEIR